ncbi:MAG TPA: tripartite tricarboxylate transporter substrate binding protein [Burkholderiales bacterium]|nr:tripartite tricarboxylate transporter substrate binding protein [Burkholderiales bacterium]
MNTIARALACAALASVATTAHAQPYPTKSIRLIVPYAPGGIVDYVGRLVGQRLSAGFGQNVVVDNRPGAGGVIGIETASRASGDGYTLVIMDPAIVINPSLLPKVPYDIHKDLTPVTILSNSPLVLAINAKVPATNIAELVNLAKSQPGKLSFASAGVGTTPHMAGELFKARIQQNIVHVPYKGSGPAMTDLIGGQVQMTFSSITAALPFIKDGRLRGLATTGAKRAAALPSQPTMIEAGFPGFEVNLWLGLFTSSSTPKNIVAALNAEVRKALANPAVAAGFEKVGAEPLGNTPPEAAAFVRNEFTKWAKVVKDAKLKAD